MWGSTSIIISGGQSLPKEGMQKLLGAQGWLKSDPCGLVVYHVYTFALATSNLLEMFVLKALLFCLESRIIPFVPQSSIS